MKEALLMKINEKTISLGSAQPFSQKVSEKSSCILQFVLPTSSPSVES